MIVFPKGLGDLQLLAIHPFIYTGCALCRASPGKYGHRAFLVQLSFNDHTVSPVPYGFIGECAVGAVIVFHKMNAIAVISILLIVKNGAIVCHHLRPVPMVIQIGQLGIRVCHTAEGWGIGKSGRNRPLSPNAPQAELV